MHRLKPFLNVGLNNFLSLRLQKGKEHQSKEKNRLYKLAIKKSINIIEIKFAVLYV